MTHHTTANMSQELMKDMANTSRVHRHCEPEIEKTGRDWIGDGGGLEYTEEKKYIYTLRIIFLHYGEKEKKYRRRVRGNHLELSGLFSGLPDITLFFLSSAK